MLSQSSWAETVKSNNPRATPASGIPTRNSPGLGVPNLKRRDPRDSARSIPVASAETDPVERTAQAIAKSPKSPRARRPSRTRNPRKQAALLIVSILLLLTGIGYFAYTFFGFDSPRESAPVATKTVEKGTSDSETVSSSPDSGSSSSNAEASTAHKRSLIDSRLKPADYAKKRWPKAEFLPVSSVRVQKGETLKLYCLLRADLDPSTLQRWKNEGLIQSDNPEYPFIRLVTIQSQAALNNLYDWHVDSVCSKLVNEQPQEQEPPANEQ